MNGKAKCKILKDIRRRIAEENDIAYVTSECKHKGNCLGTCPKCEAEVRYLEEQLEAKRRAGYAVALAGLALTVTTATASCVPNTKDGTTTTVTQEDTTIASDTTEITPLGGDPVIPETEMGEVALPDLELLLTASETERNDYISMYTRQALHAAWGNYLLSEKELEDSFEIEYSDMVCYVTVFYTASGIAQAISIDELIAMGDVIVEMTDEIMSGMPPSEDWTEQ